MNYRVKNQIEPLLKLKTISESTDTEISTYLSKMANYIGIEQMPNEETIKLIAEDIKIYYNGITPEEILLAFRLAIAGELDVDFTKVSKKKLSANLIHIVLRKYKVLRNKLEIENRIALPEKIESKKETSIKFFDKILEDYIYYQKTDKIKNEVRLSIFYDDVKKLLNRNLIKEFPASVKNGEKRRKGNLLTKKQEAFADNEKQEFQRISELLKNYTGEKDKGLIDFQKIEAVKMCFEMNDIKKLIKDLKIKI